MADVTSGSKSSCTSKSCSHTKVPGSPHCDTMMCGVYSSNTDYVLPGSEVQTNSLCVHYLAYHRADVDAASLVFVSGLTSGEETPTMEELKKPTRAVL